jgi:ECF sigma factor
MSGTCVKNDTEVWSGSPAERTFAADNLRFFMGCTIPEAAQILGIAPATAEEDWTYAKAWLRRQWRRDEKKTRMTEKNHRAFARCFRIG